MNNKGLFLGHFADIDSNDLPTGCSFAGNYYQLKVKSILNFKQAISLVYTDNNSNLCSTNSISYVNLRQGKLFTNLFKVISNLMRISRKTSFDYVVFYNLSFYSLFYFFIYSLKKRVKVIVILADAGFILETNLLSIILSKSLFLADGLLSFRVIPELKKLNVKIEVMPGLISNDQSNLSFRKKKNTVLLSGSLGYTTGLDLALKFFSCQNDFTLIITGRPYEMKKDEFELLINKYKANTIEYLGAVEYNDYKTILSTCEFGLSLRNPAEMEHRTNFPSKILEYMSFGCIVISSIS